MLERIDEWITHSLTGVTPKPPWDTFSGAFRIPPQFSVLRK
jgi:hypothetical protein